MKYTKWLICFLLFSLSSNPAIAQNVYKTPSGAKYHLGNCSYVKNVSQEITLSQAAELGLGPCKVCKPKQITSNGIVNNPRGEGITVQCKGITKKGTRCKHMTSIGNGYCFQHKP